MWLAYHKKSCSVNYEAVQEGSTCVCKLWSCSGGSHLSVVRKDSNLLKSHTIMENNHVSIKCNWMVSLEHQHAKTVQISPGSSSFLDLLGHMKWYYCSNTSDNCPICSANLWVCKTTSCDPTGSENNAYNFILYSCTFGCERNHRNHEIKAWGPKFKNKLSYFINKLLSNQR